MIAFALLATLTASEPAAVSTTQATTPQALEAMQDYGRCVASRQPKRASKLLEKDYRSDEYEQERRSFLTSMGSCVPRNSKLSGTGLLFAGALAEGLLATNYKTGLAGNIVPAAAPIASRSEIETMALCVAMNAPAETAALFSTKPASADESAAMKPLTAKLPDCLAEGQQMSLNKPGLRAVLALAALRIASAPKAAR
jgi:hypothetical protein